MSITGRGRLTWVTALTVASLLVGSTALNALADNGRGGSGHGNGGQGNEHAQTASAKHDGGDQRDDHDGGRQISVVQVAPAAAHGDGPGNSQQATTNNSGSAEHGNTGDGDHHTGTASAAATTTDAGHHEDMDRDDQDENEVEVEDEDLVTPAARVTEEERPGLGCGDADDHRGAPGNPDVQCKHVRDNDDDASTPDIEQNASDTDSDATVATADAGD